MSAEAHQEILRTEGLSKFFPGVKALDNVNFSLRRGEIMALLGENGAGKSTLIKALTGVYHADRGTIWLEGQAISPKNTAHAQQLGIGTVYQEVNLLPNMSVADNLFIGREPRRFGLLRRKEMEARATALMASYGFSLDVREPLNRFSVAMQQIVAIGRAIDLSAKVLILDEPTASLDTQEVEMLFTLMRQLRDNGVSLIFVTHFLDQVYAVSDRITVLRNGSFVGCRETRELPQIELVKMMLGRELDHNALQRAGRTLLSDKPVAAFEGYGKKGTIAPFDLQVRPGEIVGLAGLLGSGRTETAQDEGYGVDTIQAVLARRPTRPADFDARMKAVSHFRTLEESSALAAANKRVSNILAKSDETLNDIVHASVLKEAAEIKLAGNLVVLRDKLQPYFAAGRYQDALIELAALREPVDEFFENVMVNAEDKDVRINRLTLLSKLRELFLQVADISLLQ